MVSAPGGRPDPCHGWKRFQFVRPSTLEMDLGELGSILDSTHDVLNTESTVLDDSVPEALPAVEVLLKVLGDSR
jgi:hypothetical protein